MMITLFAIGMVAMSSISMAAMSTNTVRKETRFLTDKMAYELNFSTAQYNDAYEINYDFIYSIRYLMDDVMRGESWAMDRYYHLLDLRNEDLYWIMNDRQYSNFLRIEYFYRPIYASGSRWQFRIYLTYSNHNHFYFGKPHHYRSYDGGHHRSHHVNVSYYQGRYNHNTYKSPARISNNRAYTNTRRSDFSSVNIRPNSSNPPKRAKDDVYTTTSRRSSSSSASRTTTSGSNNGSSSSSSRRSSAVSSGSSNSGKSSNSTAKPSSNSSSSSSRRSSAVSSDSKDSGKSSSSKSSVSSSSSRSNSSSSSSSRSSSSSSSSRSSSSKSDSGNSSSSSSSRSSGGRR